MTQRFEDFETRPDLGPGQGRRKRTFDSLHELEAEERRLFPRGFVEPLRDIGAGLGDVAARSVFNRQVPEGGGFTRTLQGVNELFLDPLVAAGEIQRQQMESSSIGGVEPSIIPNPSLREVQEQTRLASQAQLEGSDPRVIGGRAIEATEGRTFKEDFLLNAPFPAAPAAVFAGRAGTVDDVARNIPDALRAVDPIPGLRNAVTDTTPPASGLKQVEKKSLAERLEIARKPENFEHLVPKNSPTVQKLVAALKEIGEVRETQTAAISKERSVRLGRALTAEERADVLDKSKAFREEFKTDGAPLVPDPDLTRFSNTFSETEMMELVGMIRSSDLDPFEITTADEALKKLFSPEGRLPQKNELLKLEEVFGEEFVKKVVDTKKDDKAWELVLDVWNIPRAMLSTMDISASLRQGGMLASGHPDRWIESMAAQISAFRSEDAARIIRELTESHPNFNKYTLKPTGEQRLFQADMGVNAKLGQREEAFLSKFAGTIPGIKNSERAYVTFLNKLRFDVMDDYVQAQLDAGRIVTEGELNEIARYVNWATGRGPMPTPDSINGILNGVFFSPRLFTSRLAMPLTAFSKSPGVRKQVAKDLVKNVAVGTSLITLFHLAGEAGLGGEGATKIHPVEFNSNSSDFMKIRIGNTRYDPWLGFQQIARLVSQLATGEQKSVSTGTITKRERDQIVAQFLRTKLGPGSSITVDVQQGEDLLGRPAFDRAKLGEFSPDNPLIQNITPLIIQDIHQQIQEEGLISAFKAAPAVVGVGTTVFEGKNDVRRQVMNEFISEGTLPFDNISDIETLIREAPDFVSGVIDQDARVIQFDKEQNERLASSAKPGGFFNSRRQLDADFLAAESELKDLHAPILNPNGSVQKSGQKYREKVAQLQRDRVNRLDQLADAFPNIIDSLEPNNEISSEFREALRKYTETIFDNNLEDNANIFNDVLVDFDFDERQERLEGLRDEDDLGDEMVDRIEAFIRQGEPELITELREDREFLSEYFRTTRNTILLYGGQRLLDQWKQYLTLNSLGKRRFLNENIQLDDALSFANEEKNLFREFQDPEIERKLLKWGYVSCAKNARVIEDHILMGIDDIECGR